ncbi:beta-lactamase family protein [Photobacterium sp. BZF1]|uniref:serine hydrolase domain-containing protein n=1 Tax=Photobacterium sp. BZF1 TaxID=1904457 RepID=UPI00165355DF|nr:serine hydrolase domain-containing protein [Photobacterium sp. BZF1]MBC7001091.1 beta-lactamase family protein [Photobacterium sp. BZF1]
MKLKNIALFLALATSTNASADIPAPMKEALKVPGADVTFNVDRAKQPFSPQFASEAKQAFNNFHLQMGGDHAVYYNGYMTEVLPSALSRPNEDYKPLARNINSRIGDLKAETGQGMLSLDEYMENPMFRTQAMIMVHKGQVVYEAYPGMNKNDRHVWYSTAKTTVGLVMAKLVQQGKVDTDKLVPEYIPELKGTAWDDIRVESVLNMTTGLDNEEVLESILQPDSPVVRYFAAMTGSPRASTGEFEDWLTDVAVDQEKLEGEKQGDLFRYASINTSILVQIIENVEDKTWSKVFEEKVWSKLYAREPAAFGLTPAGHALAVGFLQTTPEDMVRFATLFTPSWKAVASEQVVTPELIDIIRNEADPERYVGTAKEAQSVSAFQDKAQGNGFQFDYIWEDGGMAKSGNMNQMIYMDPERDFAAMVVSTSPYHSGYGETKAPAYMRLAAKYLNGELAITQ